MSLSYQFPFPLNSAYYLVITTEQYIMEEHNQKIQAIAASIKDFRNRQQPFRLYHGSTGRTNTIWLHPKKVIDTSRLNNVLFIDKDAGIADYEPNVDMETLVNTTLNENLVPLVVTELSVGRLDLLVCVCHNRLCTYRIKLPCFQESNTVGV